MSELTQADTGIPKTNANIVVDPQSQFSADELNKAIQAAIHNSRTGPRWLIKFLTNTGTSYPVDLAHGSDFVIKSHWGTGTGIVTIQKTAANTYEITLVSPQTDILGASEVISLTHLSWKPNAWSSDALDQVFAHITRMTGTVVTITTESVLGTGADLGNNSGSTFNVEVAIP